MNPIILIPARMGSTRLPGKMLMDINGAPLIARVTKQALEANIGPVLVCCDHPDIQAAVEAVGAKAVLTDPDLPSGSDRIHQGLQLFDPSRTYNTIINLQGDLPDISAPAIKAALSPLEDSHIDVGTVATPITTPDDFANPNIVKIALAWKDSAPHKALYFSRAPIPSGPGPHFHHIGIYTYRRPALERFVSLPPSPLEQQEKLEQLRLLENGLTIGVGIIDHTPLSIDTAEDIVQARKLLTL